MLNIGLGLNIVLSIGLGVKLGLGHGLETILGRSAIQIIAINQNIGIRMYELENI
jgi:hypothetical protein